MSYLFLKYQHTHGQWCFHNDGLSILYLPQFQPLILEVQERFEVSGMLFVEYLVRFIVSISKTFANAKKFLFLSHVVSIMFPPATSVVVKHSGSKLPFFVFLSFFLLLRKSTSFLKKAVLYTGGMRFV